MSILMGIIADDFTGGSDAASFFANHGIPTFLSNGIPKDPSLRKKWSGDHHCVIVIAQKIRSIAAEEAVAHALDACCWLRKEGAEKLFYKYCSTFDSTPKGNIGPITDAILEAYDYPYTFLAPGLPVNGRTVEQGILKLYGVPLAETHMKNHPVNPMWDSRIAELMRPQGKYPCIELDRDNLYQSREKIDEYVKTQLSTTATAQGRKGPYYVIPDYTEAQDADQLVAIYSDCDFWTGGSGLNDAFSAQFLKQKNIDATSTEERVPGKTILFSGSCSEMTLQQIAHYRHRYPNKAVQIAVREVMEGNPEEKIWEKALSIGDGVLIYSSDDASGRSALAKVYNQEEVSNRLEKLMGRLAQRAYAAGFNKLIIAGGETSGAITTALNFSTYQIGKSIAPGVPVMIPVENEKARLILKSGNFGQKNFFEEAISFLAPEIESGRLESAT